MIPKFRAWDKFDKVIRDVTLLDYNQFFVGYSYPVFMKSTMHMELMRSTGLHDKNGQEIFEGDVLEIEDEGEVLGNAKLTWNNEQAVFMIEAINVDDIAPFYEILSDESYSYRVVGNVYDNPELLEVKDEK